MKIDGRISLRIQAIYIIAMITMSVFGSLQTASADESYGDDPVRYMFEKNHQSLETRIAYVTEQMELWRSDSMSEQYFRPIISNLTEQLELLQETEDARQAEIRKSGSISASDSKLYMTVYVTQVMGNCEPESREERNEWNESMLDAFRASGLKLTSNADEIRQMFEDSLAGKNDLNSEELELNVFQQLQHEGRIEDARRFIARALARRQLLFGNESTEAIDALYYFGYSYFADGLYDIAQEIFRRVVDRYPHSNQHSITVALALQRLGQIQEVSGDVDSAIDFYSGAEGRLVDAYNSMVRKSRRAGVSLVDDLSQRDLQFIKDRSILDTKLSAITGLAFRAGLKVWHLESVVHKLFGMLIENDPLSYFDRGCGRPSVDFNKRPLYAVMAEALIETGRLELAQEFLEDARANAERVSAHSNDRGFARYLRLKAILSEATGETELALNYHRRAFDLVTRNLSELSTRQFEARFSVERMAQAVVGSYIAFLHSEQARGLMSGEELFDESFQASQVLSERASGRAYRSLAQALAANEEGAAGLIGRKRRLETDIGELRREIKEQVSAGTLPDSTVYNTLEELTAELANTNESISSEFPTVGTLLSLKPVSVEEVRQHLRPNEAMVNYSVDANGQILARIITNDVLVLQTIALSKAEIKHLISDFRQSLEPDASGRKPEFNAHVAYRLYDELIGSMRRHFGGVERLVFVTYDDLDALPFPALLTEPMERNKAEELSEFPWLIKRYATSVIPSVSTFSYVRSREARQDQEQRFLGVADPDFDGFFSNLSRATASLDVFRGADGFISLQDLPPLPETRSEVERLATNLGYDESVFLFGVDASEQRIKALELSKFSILVFSTHAVLANELKDIVEPSLALSSPGIENQSGSDGVLTASEIAALNLDADVVILAACNTARSSDPGILGLSRLARAFIVAGARRLVVSHWKVHSEASVELFSALSGGGAITEDPGSESTGAGYYSESLRQAALRLVEGKTEEDYSHPMYWAAFFVVGA